MVFGCISCSEFGRRVLRTRPLAYDNKLDTRLKRCLTAPSLMLYCVAQMIGAALYVLTGTLIHDLIGPATFIGYSIAAFTAVFTAMCYAEFITLFPRAGSVYTYTYLMLGELPAFVIGWTMISDALVSMAVISKALSGTINMLTNNTIREWSEQHLKLSSDNSVLESSPDLVAAGFILILILIGLTGAHLSLTLSAILSALQIGCLIALTTACFIFGNPSNLINDGGFLPFGLNGLLRGTGLALFGFSGFEYVANASEEAKNPRRDIPIALFLALSTCAVLYVSASLGLSYLVPRLMISSDSPFVGAFSRVSATGMMEFAAFSTILATGATKIVSMHAVPRMFYAIASDGLLFPCMAHVASCTKVPILSLLIAGLISNILATFIRMPVLAEFTSVGIIFSYFMIGLNLMILRYHFNDKSGFFDDELKTCKSPPDSDTSTPVPSALRIRSSAPNCVRIMASRRMFSICLVGFIIVVIAGGICLNIILKTNVAELWLITFGFSLATIILFFMLCLYEPMKNSKGFETPWMPLAPCITMLSNGILITSMDALTWIRFGVWTAVGLLVYFAYGIWHSKADAAWEEPNEDTIEEEHSEQNKDADGS